MSEMIERVANALLAAQWAYDPSQGNAFWQLDTLPEASRAYWLDLARAAIAAMREPLREMFIRKYEDHAADLVDEALR